MTFKLQSLRGGIPENMLCAHGWMVTTKYGLPRRVRSVMTGIEGTHCEVHLLPDPSGPGWIVELWNWQDDEGPRVNCRAAFPRPVTTGEQYAALLKLMEPNIEIIYVDEEPQKG